MTAEQIAAVLKRYEDGNTTPQENKSIEHWLDAVNNPDASWPVWDRPAKDQWLATVFTEIHASIHKEQLNVVKLPGRNKIVWRSIAAVAAVVFIAITLYLQSPVHSDHNSTPLISLVTRADQKTQITLADGSKVWVNAGSELKYPKVFQTGTREVYLSGEAYFDIAHDASKPFIIHTGTITTRVLGTAFNIKEDKLTHIVKVTVTRGKVSVAHGSQLLGVLTPNQQISFNGDKNSAVKEHVDAQRITAWQHDDLQFEDINFGDAVAQLQDQFHVKIVFSNDKLRNCRFSGTSLNGQDLDKILDVICAFNNATYTRKADGSILIEGAGCDK
ncbi:FecR family protein [Pedobacter duraquae]|uniref:FecR family protein n=1 Tax=Pedobacter duraquae TaxID=425511 RepID=A0A4R6IE30_9SPHI|nr:FecR domain-containing protein [Pedobacter duraquae]TDO19976.1 FecR family protein [Pedobacter duraquae]